MLRDGETKGVSVEHESRCGAVAIKRVPRIGMPMVGQMHNEFGGSDRFLVVVLTRLAP